MSSRVSPSRQVCFLPKYLHVPKPSGEPLLQRETTFVIPDRKLHAWFSLRFLVGNFTDNVVHKSIIRPLLSLLCLLKKINLYDEGETVRLWTAPQRLRPTDDASVLNRTPLWRSSADTEVNLKKKKRKSKWPKIINNTSKRFPKKWLPNCRILSLCLFLSLSNFHTLSLSFCPHQEFLAIIRT